MTSRGWNDGTRDPSPAHAPTLQAFFAKTITLGLLERVHSGVALWWSRSTTVGWAKARPRRSRRSAEAVPRRAHAGQRFRTFQATRPDRVGTAHRKSDAPLLTLRIRPP